MAEKPDPAKDPEFQKVIRHFVTTPPKPDSELKIGKRKTVGAESGMKRRVTRPAGAPTYRKPMIVIGIGGVS
jgi:hypothetical protein